MAVFVGIRRLWRASIGAAVVGLVVAGAVAAPAQATGTSSVWVPKHMCNSTARGHASCFALKLVLKRVKSGSAEARAAGVRPAIQQPGPAGGYSPADIAAMYGLNPNQATAQTVAIVDAFNDPNILSDLNTFDAANGLPAETATSFKVLNQSGAASPLPANDAGWAGEETLDVQAVRGLCHKCKIVLYEATTNSFANLATAVNTAVSQGAKIVSNSYGGPEGGMTQAQVAAYNHQHVVITASTGDDGWFDWDNFNEGGSSANVPQTPAALNTVVAVSGTSLYQNPDGSRQSEQVWNENGPADIWGFNLGAALGAAGGGCSTIYAAKPFQHNVAGYTGLGCGGKRSTTDVAAVADPYTGYDIYDSFQSSGWQTFGGTSLAAPVIAAIFGLAGGPHNVAYPAQTLYDHFATDSSTTLYDVTLGGTGLCGPTTSPQSCYSSAGNPNQLGGGMLDCEFAPTGTAILANRYQCRARPGYDGVAGVGTPNGILAFKP